MSSGLRKMNAVAVAEKFPVNCFRAPQFIGLGTFDFPRLNIAIRAQIAEVFRQRKTTSRPDALQFAHGQLEAIRERFRPPGISDLFGELVEKRFDAFLGHDGPEKGA